MKRRLQRVVAAITLAAAVTLGSTAVASAQPAPGVPITFLVATCPASSAMYRAVTSGADPRSSDNGSPASVPSDITAYGCTQTSGAYSLAMLGGSTAGGTFTDAALTHAANPGTAGIAPGQSYYARSGQPAARQFFVPQFPVTGTNWPGLPYLDLQCGTDGVHNDNGDGIGWGPQAITSQQYCILYVAPAAASPSPSATTTPSSTATATATATSTTTPAQQQAAAASPSPTATATATSTATPAHQQAAAAASSTAATPTPSPARIIVHEEIGTIDKRGKLTWKAAPASNTWTFVVTDASGTIVQTLDNNKTTTVPSGGYSLGEQMTAAQQAAYSLTSVEVSSGGAKECNNGPQLSQALLPLNGPAFAQVGNGTVHICAFNEARPTDPPKIDKTFVSATANTVTWKLQPSAPADLLVWDAQAATCRAFGAASCGDIVQSGGRGSFSATGQGQYLLVTQKYVKRGDNCQVDNTAQWAPADRPAAKTSVKASYKCSGTPALGWPLLAVSFMAAVGVAWFVRKRTAQ